MDLLFHPELPPELANEILVWCPVHALNLISRISKAWHARARVILDLSLYHGIAFFTYSEIHDRVSMNWWGVQSYGSVHVRGTSINIMKGRGKALSLRYPIEDDDEDDDYHTRDSVNMPHDVYRSDSTTMRLEKIKTFTASFPKITIAQLKADSDFDYIEFDMCQNPYFKYTISDEQYRGTILKDDCSSLEKLYFIDDYTAFVEELRRVYAIAKRHHVTFFWV
jgi:hypothetical protein